MLLPPGEFNGMIPQQLSIYVTIAETVLPNVAWLQTKLEVHSVERIYLRQRCFDASKPRIAASMGPQYQYVHGIFPT